MFGSMCAHGFLIWKYSTHNLKSIILTICLLLRQPGAGSSVVCFSKDIKVPVKVRRTLSSVGTSSSNMRSSPCSHVCFSLSHCLLHLQALCCVHLTLFPKILSCIETIVFQCKSNPGMFARILSCIEMLLFHCRFNPGMFARCGRNIPILLESYPNAQRLDI
jgi:hypothetical protein